MSTDALSKRQNWQARGKPQNSPGARRWKHGLLAIGILAVLASAAALLPGALSSRESGPAFTHKIARGDLVVSITEQGTLESSNNTEIKCKVRGYSTVIWVIEGGTVVKAGDELVRLDTKRIEDAISLQTTNYHTAAATLAQSKAEVAKAEIAIPAYLEGSYQTQLKSLERGLTIARTNLETAEKMLANSRKLFKQGYVTELEVEGNAFTVTQAKLELGVAQTEIDVLNKYTKEMQMETLNGNLIASKSKLEADKAGLAMDKARLDRAKEELVNCVIKAERDGLVIYPSAAAWKETPDITEGATIRKDQVLLLMPDLTKMQVKVGIHESIVDRVKAGQKARITLPDRTLEGKVSSVSPVTRPAGWWTGNVVKYDTIIELPSVDGLKPGMSAEIEVVMDRHEDVLTIPVAAVVETADGDFCWVKTAEQVQRRLLQLGDTNDSFIVVKAGLKEAEEVVLDPLAFIEEAQNEALKPVEETKASDKQAPESGVASGATANPETDNVN
ncbi:MAG: efflux RND transporter periplasmic adaptor subunit [Planctomycetota bacterium]|jgi:multidrug efflux pump subunit AcrA (membrane-fusion protein)